MVLQHAWKKAPVSLEVCSTIKGWKEELGYDIDDVRYIIDESLKWHISSFNNKSSGIPVEWWPEINRWLKKMGYRFVLRKFTYPGIVKPNSKLPFTSWWDNKGVAPCYKDFTLALRLFSDSQSIVLPTDAVVKEWLPGDNIYDHSLFIPDHVPEGNYELQVAVVDRRNHEPRVNLAIEGRKDDGWYQLGQIEVVR